MQKFFLLFALFLHFLYSTVKAQLLIEIKATFLKKKMFSLKKRF